jgi:hypothetical protein
MFQWSRATLVSLNQSTLTLGVVKRYWSDQLKWCATLTHTLKQKIGHATQWIESLVPAASPGVLFAAILSTCAQNTVLRWSGRVL